MKEKTAENIKEKDTNNFSGGKRRQNGQRKKKVRELSVDAGEVEEKGEMLQKAGDT